MFPVTLDLTGRTVVAVGYGAVGRRKAAAAQAAGAGVVVVDPLQGPDPDRPSHLWVAEPYRPAHLDVAALVFACAPPDVNARVVADCRARNIWVNSASDPAAGDFSLPAVHAVGGLWVAVSTGGAAPGLARRVRDRVAGQFDAAFAAWVDLLNEVRGEVLATVPDPARRRQLLDGFADWAWLDRLRAEGAEAVRAAIRAVVRGG
jgi:precorrin-2 dehydrogenase/sirohydrochlorin ferrochelatase